MDCRTDPNALVLDPPCENEIENHKECKNFWYKVEKARGLAGISPSLPPMNERSAFLKKYAANPLKIPVTPD